MTCSVEGCGSPVQYKGFCGKHYKRQWRHGDPNSTAYWRKEFGLLCEHPECLKLARHGNFCTAHYIRNRRYGSLERIRSGIRENNNHNNGIHRIAAAKALGKELPPNAVIHHHNGDPSTLVICPDQAYHMLIHSRMRRLKLKLPLTNFTSY